MLIAQMPHRICFAIQCLQSNGKNGNLAPRNDVSLQVSTWTSIVSVAFDCYRFTVNSVLYLQQFGKDLVCVKHALWQTSTASCSIPWRPSTQDSKPVYREATATIHFPHHCAEGWIEKKIRKAWLSSEIFERDWLDEKADREKLEEIVLLDLIWTEIRLTGIS